MQLLSELHKDTLVLTPNLRLSAYFLREIGKTRHTFIKPAIEGVDQWSERLWDTYGDGTPLANTHQMRTIWQEIINQESDAGFIQNPRMANPLQSAYQTLQQWNVSIDDVRLAESESGHLLQRFAKQFETTCKRLWLLTPEQMVLRLIALIKSRRVSLPKHIICFAFLEHSPLQQQLFEAIATQGTRITSYESPALEAKKTHFTFTNESDEFLAMASYAKTLGPKKRIACIVPQLKQKRSAIRHAFERVFGVEETLSYNISAGQTLSEFPILKSVFLILKCVSSPLKVEEYDGLLRCPFIASAESEMGLRAKLSVHLRKKNLESLSLTSLVAEARNNGCHALVKALEALQSISLPRTQTLSQWKKSIVNILQSVGFPGERILDSAEYQTLQRFLQCLDDFCTLESILERISFPRAIQNLQLMTINTEFQAQSPQTHIQILGILEAAGQPFDEIWMSGLTDSEWPPSPSPNPFIPFNLQQSLAMPHCNAERERHFTQMMMAQFSKHTPHLIASHALTEGDKALRPSPYLSDFDSALQPIATPDPYPETLNRKIRSESIVEKNYPVNASENIRGGSSLLKSQSHCGFQAFALYRLGSERLENPDIGYSPAEHGTLLHRALELFWGKTRSQEALLRLSNDEILARIQESVKAAMLKHSSSIMDMLEQKRLVNTIAEWIILEKSRSPFVVKSIEGKINLRIGPLELSLKADRIDQVIEGSSYEIIIDYKTGTVKLSDWFGTRIKEPQLPLYLMSGNYSGIAYANVKKQSIAFQGIIDESLSENLLKPIDNARIKSDVDVFEDQIVLWKSHLTSIATDFIEGNAALNPIDSMACQRCHLHGLCRIEENKRINEVEYDDS